MAKTLVNEIGVLAADEAEAWEGPHFRDALIYREKEPPGRDVWVGRSGVSGRTIEIVHHVNDDDESKIQGILKGLGDSEADGQLAWAAFDLSCRTPGGCGLESHRFNAGDLKLEFARKSERMEIRQIAVAHVALKRRALEKWLEDECGPRMKRYSCGVERRALKVKTQSGLVLEGPIWRLDRRKRILLRAGLPGTVWQRA